MHQLHTLEQYFTRNKITSTKLLLIPAEVYLNKRKISQSTNLNVYLWIEQYVLWTSKLDDATSQRWIADVANFEIIYKPGTLNLDADGLSRITDSNWITSEAIKPIFNLTNMSPNVKCIFMTTSSIEKLLDLSEYTEIDLKYYQQNDPVLGCWFPYIRDKYLSRKYHFSLYLLQYHAAIYGNFEKSETKKDFLLEK